MKIIYAMGPKYRLYDEMRKQTEVRTSKLDAREPAGREQVRLTWTGNETKVGERQRKTWSELRRGVNKKRGVFFRAVLGLKEQLLDYSFFFFY